MANLRALPLHVLAVALLCSAALPAQRFAPTSRIVTRIDESNLVALKGNTHPAANAANDRGRVSPDLPMTDLILVLSRDPAQQAAFDKFVASQYDQNSPNFHQWLTPEQVGTNFGPSEADLATVTGWLTGRGFSIAQVTKDHMSIRFSGKASQVESTFHTEIHNLSVNGESHIGNMSDPQIPAALAPVVIGVKSLHNFFPKPLHHLGQQVTRDNATGKWQRSQGALATRPSTSTVAARPLLGGRARPEATARPQFGISVGGTSPYLVEDIGPWDFATIYNILPLWSGTTAAGVIDGTGQTIAIAGTSDIEVGQTGETGTNGQNDIATFRNYFDLPTNNVWNTPKRISGNSQPLTVCSNPNNTLCNTNDLLENSLDVEWSGAVAKNAQIVLVASYPASATDDNLYDSESYIVNNVTARIMNVSYGACELALGTGGNVQYNNLWETAYTEGIAVFVATGDSGSPSCDQGGDATFGVPYLAESGLSVSGIASTPYNTAVGGTDFNWCSLTSSTECTAAPYWSSSNTVPPGGTNPSLSALGYVPEVPWNDTCTSPLALGFMESFFSGVYTVTDAESGCNAFVVYAQQLSNIGDGSVLGIVDTVGGGGGASGCVVGTPAYSSVTGELSGCAASSTTTTGTSTNPDTGATQAPVSLYNNGWIKPSWQTGVTGIPSDGVRDIPDVSFFASDGFLSSSAYLICASDVAACSYSSRTEPVAQEVGGTSVATPAMAGVMALINQKTGAPQGSPNTELYTLAASQTYSSCSSERGNGAPLTSGSCLFNDIDKGTNAMACDYSAYVNTPSPNCTVIHSGDYVGVLPGYSAGTGYDQATGLGSLNVANIVNAWPKLIGANPALVTVAPTPNPVDSGVALTVTVTVASSAAGGATPTGNVSLTASGSSYSATGTLVTGSYTFTIPAKTLAVGTDTLTASYVGDATYAPATATSPVTVTGVVLPQPTVTVSATPATLNSNQTVAVTGTVTGAAGTPTGSVTLVAGSYTATATLSGTGGFTFTVPADALVGSATGQIDILTVTYGGSTAYQSATGSANVTVMSSTFTINNPAPAIAPAAAGTTTGIAPGASATATVTVAAVAGYTGIVTLTCQDLSTTATGGDGATCSGGGAGSQITLGTSGTVVFTVGTTAAVASLKYPQIFPRNGGWLGGGAVLALLVFFGIPARRRAWRSMLGMVALIAVLGGLAACGGGGSSGGGGSGGQSDPGTTAGKYTFTVVATGTATDSTIQRQETTFTVVVN